MAGRPAFDWSPYKEEIKLLHRNGYTQESIINELAERYPGCHIGSRKSLKNQLNAWGFGKRYKAIEDPEILDFIREEWLANASHDDILNHLAKTFPDAYIDTHALFRIRKTLNLRYRRRGEVTQEEEDEIREGLISILEEHGGDMYGRDHLLPTLRREGLLVAQHTLRSMLRRIDPTGVSGRDGRMQRREGKMRVAGPGRFYSCDGYDKLKPWGFHIYGFIDGYSRYVTQVYCGVDNKTSVSVLAQYLLLVARQMQIPRLLRSDKGVETPLMAWAHVLLRRAINIIEQWNEIGDAELFELEYKKLPFRACFSWGKSTRNIRIERWWRNLAHSSLNTYRQYFQGLSHGGMFDDTLPDRIAIKYVYMRMLRARINGFVDTHKYNL